MNTHSSSNRSRPFSILAAVMLAALVPRAFGDVPHDPAIFDAAAQGNTYSALTLLRDHPDLVNDRDGRSDLGWTPLQCAVAANQTNMVELLLENQADVNARDSLGNVPLHRAALEDRWNIAVLLLAHGATVNARNDLGDTPLYNAVINRHMDLVQLLLSKNADVNATNYLGLTPLQVAVANGDVDMVNLLLASKAAINAVDNKGWTPLQYAYNGELIPREKAAATALEDLLDQSGARTSANAQPPAELSKSLTGWQVADLQQMREQIAPPPEIISFIRAREKMAAAGNPLSPDLADFFAAAQSGRARDAEALYYLMLNDPNSPAGKGAVGQMVAETLMAFEPFGMADSGLVMTLARDYLASLPAGCIYFGGTDPGRGLPTAFCRSPGDQIFVLTQNALSSKGYLQYVHDLYGSRISLPAPDEVSLPAGHDQIAVMQTNAVVAREVFDKNPDREFYYEQSFPIEWMYPYLIPHGVVMKLNHTALDSIPTNDVQEDMQFWSAKIKQLESRPEFAADDTRTMYSHLRSTIGDVFTWRANPANNTNTNDSQRMYQAAATAYKQSLYLFPSSPEAFFGYVQLNLHSGNTNAALVIARAAVHADPSSHTFSNLLQMVESTVAAKAAPKPPAQ